MPRTFTWTKRGLRRERSKQSKRKRGKTTAVPQTSLLASISEQGQLRPDTGRAPGVPSGFRAGIAS